MPQVVTVVLALLAGLAATAVSFVVFAVLGTAVGLLPTDAEATVAAVAIGAVTSGVVIRRRLQRRACEVA